MEKGRWITKNGEHVFIENERGKRSSYNSQADPAKTLSERVKNAKNSTRSLPEKAVGFVNKERKNTKHHKKHALEMGYKNQDEYERAAVDFFNSDKGKLYYCNKDSRFYRYDERSHLFAVSSNGVIHTFMRYSKKKFEQKIKDEELHEIR